MITAGARIPRALRYLLDLTLPPGCAGCGTALPRGSRGPRICPGCRTRLRPLPSPRCPRCHAPRGTGLPPDRPCPECSGWPPELSRARSAYVLVEPADALVHALKYGGWLELAGEMAEFMARTLAAELRRQGDVLLVPVPTTPSRERERGYNQAALLARALSRATGLPLAEALIRREGGSTQVSLHPSERRANVREAFSLAENGAATVQDRHVLLVDDVLTTGATGTAAAEVLVRGGARQAELITFARALPGSEAGTDPAGSSGVFPIPPEGRPDPTRQPGSFKER
jgi:ComF family protein